VCRFQPCLVTNECCVDKFLDPGVSAATAVAGDGGR
jgi:hypothetical protein